MAGRFLVFGDIHGEWQKLESLLEQVQPDYAQDEVVFLGDYIDRGPEPKRVLDYIMGLSKRDNIHLLRGNHEAMMWDTFAEYWNRYHQQPGAAGNMDIWKRNGGKVTLQQVSGTVEEFKRYADFVNSLPMACEAEIGGRTYLFAHAGVDPARPLEDQTDTELIYGRTLFYLYKEQEKISYMNSFQEPMEVTVVVGHTPTPFIKESCYTPIVTPEIIFMDTGSFMPEGCISCMDLRSGKVWQSRS